MKKTLIYILLLVLSINIQLFANGNEEIVNYEMDIMDRTDNVSSCT